MNAQIKNKTFLDKNINISRLFKKTEKSLRPKQVVSSKIYKFKKYCTRPKTNINFIIKSFH